jgi:hypothetical protein
MAMSRKNSVLRQDRGELAVLRVNGIISAKWRFWRLLGGLRLAYLTPGFALPARILCHPADRQSCSGKCAVVAVHGGPFVPPCQPCRAVFLGLWIALPVGLSGCVAMIGRQGAVFVCKRTKNGSERNHYRGG